MSPAPRGSSRVRRLRRPVQPIFDLTLANRAVPLVKRVAVDIVELKTRLSHRQGRLRASISQTSRSSRERFVLEDEVRRIRGDLRTVIDELHAMGVVLLNPSVGEVGFPTIVNGSLAYLVYRSECDAVIGWRYRDQAKLRPLPAHWQSAGSWQSNEEDEGLCC